MQRWFELHPHRATEKGYRQADTLAPLYEETQVAQFVGWARETQMSLIACGNGQAHHRDLLATHLAGAVRTFEKNGEALTNPAFYLQAGLDGLEALQLRYPEPPWSLLRNRLAAFPELLNNGRNRLLLPETPGVLLAQEMAEESLEGLQEQYDHTGVPHETRESAWDCLRSLERYRNWLEHVESREFQPMGEERLDEMLQREHLLDRPSGEWDALAREALRSLPEVESQNPPSTTSHALTREEAWQFFVDEIHRVENFVRQSGIVTIPDGELKLCRTPAYLASLIPGAYYQEPALFAGERTGRFYLPPLPNEWTSQVQARYRARQRRGGFANLVVHEAWPGHHLQYLHAAVHHDPLANVRDNDVMLEGWALYCEELMEEMGLFGKRPFGPRVDSLRMRIARVVVDIGLHTGRMTITEAESFMAESLGVSISPWLRAEVRRYSLEPGQPMSYWLGSVLIQELRDELDVQRVHYQTFHDSLLRWGPIPVPLIRKRMLEET